jgi:hypothetical protein
MFSGTDAVGIAQMSSVIPQNAQRKYDRLLKIIQYSSKIVLFFCEELITEGRKS